MCTVRVKASGQMRFLPSGCRQAVQSQIMVITAKETQAEEGPSKEVKMELRPEGWQGAPGELAVLRERKAPGGLQLSDG